MNQQAGKRERQIEEEQLQCPGKKVTDCAACDTPAVGQRGRRGGMWEKKQKRKWYLFLISPENWRFFVLFLRSVNIDRLRESYTYALAQSLHSPSQFYAEI